MAVNITPDGSAFTTVITVPTDGDNANGTEVALTTQALANRDQYIFDNFPQLNTVTDFMVPIGYGQPQENDEWQLSSSDGWRQPIVTNSELIIEVTSLLPTAGNTINSITAYVNGGAGHAGLPANVPNILLVRYVKTSGALTVVASQSDTSADVTAYQLDHTIVVAAIAHTILADTRYVIIVTGENGANSIVNQFGLFAIEMGWTVT